VIGFLNRPLYGAQGRGGRNTYSGFQLDEVNARNPVSLRNRVSQYLTQMKTAILLLVGCCALELENFPPLADGKGWDEQFDWAAVF